MEGIKTIMSKDHYEALHTLRAEFAQKGYSRRAWMMNATPAEQEVFWSYRQKGQRRAAVGGIIGASAMAGVWKMASLRKGLGIAGVIVGGMIGANVSMRTSNIRREMITEVLLLPGDKSPRAAEAREILRTKLPNNAFVQEMMRNPVSANERWMPAKSP
ncbi:hypothetical protein BBJ29_010169 [Phytophthora kernoviae]|uniref:Uncharacterized protein n=1 Tax=Phytophthora kernoviae TaxID=325452 RepID=A0A3F2RAN3_9STRA|nr:hypothetical protein BBP00_00010137 [Phytophthora kernoviae]RLN59209.1 hypothetical protein BBJ29_010169 [Phytophthora kernoviae]